MSRADDAVMRLYESADLRDELTDDEADYLLKWAEGEIARLDQTSPDDAAFEAQVDTLLGMLKRMNRFAGQQGQLSAQADDPLPGRIAQGATELGHAATPEQIAAAGTGDPSGTLRALTGLLSAAGAVAPGTPEPPTGEAPANPPAEPAGEMSPNPPVDSAVQPPEPPPAEPASEPSPSLSDTDAFFFGDND